MECGGLRETRERCGVGEVSVWRGLRSKWRDTRGCWMRCGWREGSSWS